MNYDCVVCGFDAQGYGPLGQVRLLHATRRVGIAYWHFCSVVCFKKWVGEGGIDKVEDENNGKRMLEVLDEVRKENHSSLREGCCQ